ncbi:hypothetical protein B5E77_10390 [Lachnoclostridium sp. An131]|uniref:D-alanyl-D-alanine carboxypeptidase family protein n=1 Tax=Lachnoclostridium sp. An131 TaxID=1965555 RepID=UPI000B3A9421|nr:serine hydrolase [Lachnoclostridium sp. An131]OUQ25873.1 hypothetical protein B5E77_10390 [Lachnoclostridium sp. An131]
MRDFEAEERINRALRARRRGEIRRRRRRRARIKRALVLGGTGLCLFLIILAGVGLVKAVFGRDAQAAEQAEQAGEENGKAGGVSGALASTGQLQNAIQQLQQSFQAEAENEITAASAEAADYSVNGQDAAAALTSEEVISTRALLVDWDTRTVIAQRGAGDRINPASMTKILTLLVAVEHITDLDDTFTITREITDYSYSNDCSAAGFEDGETVTVRDLLYGTILPSGADAAAGLAFYVSGSLEGFADLMNQKLEELGLSDTAHFTNCVGLYDENHYCTLYDMAVILGAAIDNDICREVLSAHIYTTSATEQHPEGLELSNWFLRRIEDKDTHGTVMCAKTGYVVQSGNCAASYSVSNNGKQYICVTADAYNSWRCIYDHVAIYQEYTE